MGKLECIAYVAFYSPRLNTYVHVKQLGQCVVFPQFTQRSKAHHVTVLKKKGTKEPSFRRCSILDYTILHYPNSSGSSGQVRGGPRNMKSMWPPSVAIFFMTYFYRAGGAWPHRPPWIRYCPNIQMLTLGPFLYAPLGCAVHAKWGTVHLHGCT